MGTYMANPQTVERKWYVIDAAGKVMGRVAAEAATLLKGKHKVDYTPHVDCGDFVIILNSDKLEQKVYYRHTGYPGGLKETKYRILMQNNSCKGVELAVKGMLPKNSIGRSAMKRLFIYKGAEHKNQAQKPEIWAMD